MSDVQLEFSARVARALDDYTPPSQRMANWGDVLRRAGARPNRERRRWFVLAAAGIAVLAALSLATPLGGAIRDRVGDFSAWLRGEPGQPVSAEEQRAFDEQNERSFASFPGSPQLRRLTKTEVDGVTYDLFGFRSGGALCVRLVATGEARGSTTACAPVADLEKDEAPVRVLFADWGVGKGEKTATIGFNSYRAPRARVSAGIAADGVESVELSITKAFIALVWMRTRSCTSLSAQTSNSGSRMFAPSSPEPAPSTSHSRPHRGDLTTAVWPARLVSRAAQPGSSVTSTAARLAGSSGARIVESRFRPMHTSSGGPSSVG